MNPTHATQTTKFKVGLFTVLGLLLIGVISVYVNDRPYWWHPCQLVKISVEDATGLKTKSPIRSLGLEIGFLKSVDLTETHVTLGICITAPVEVLPSTRAYIRGEGFLGDKFVELKPVRYIGGGRQDEGVDINAGSSSRIEKSRSYSVSSVSAPHHGGFLGRAWDLAWDWLIPAAHAADESGNENENGDAPRPVASARPAPQPRRARDSEREIPVGENSQDIQALVSKVDGLVGEMTGLTQNLREGINPDELRQTMRQLNKTLENASKTLSPEGGLNQTAQRTLAKLEDAIEQLRDMLTRINKGEGSVGMLLNDPVYAEEIKKALRNLNKLLNKVDEFRFVVNIFVEELNAYSGSRGGGTLAIWPNPTRYYLLGVESDVRGTTTITQTTTTAGGVATSTNTVQTADNAIRFTGMLGKVFFRRVDLSAGFLFGDGAVSAMFNLGPVEREQMLQIRNDTYGLPNNGGLGDRVRGIVHPIPFFSTLYATAGIEDFRQVNGHSNFFYGAGITFDDEDIKLLFALK